MRAFLPTALLAVLPALLPAQPAAEPAPLPREFRGAWVATVDNIDWPSRPGLPAAAARAELTAVLDRARELRLNALVFQVRPACDALYRSDLEPWSEWLTGADGRAPDEAFDPLAFAVAGAHARGLELHAWCNPFRARADKAKSPPSATSVATRHPDWCVPYGDFLWLDPGHPDAVAWTLRVMLDVVARYDVDGIHVDDYFYPYPKKGIAFADHRSFARYQQGGGKLARDDWRRQNIDGFLQQLYAGTKERKPWVKVGISPFGIARPGLPAGIDANAFDQYAQLYADVIAWQRRAPYDYLAPQLYWAIDAPGRSFATLLPWWLAQNPKGRHVWPGLNTNLAVTGKPPWRRQELRQQIELLRGAGPASGHVHFSFHTLRDLPAPVAQLATTVYAQPALVPASPWLDRTPPPAPVGRRERDRDGSAVLAWERPAATVRFGVVQARNGAGWAPVGIFDAAAGRAPLPPAVAGAGLVLQWVSRTGIAGPTTRLPD